MEYYLYIHIYIYNIIHVVRCMLAILNGPSEPLNGQADHHQSDWQFLGKTERFFSVRSERVVR